MEPRQRDILTNKQTGKKLLFVKYFFYLTGKKMKKVFFLCFISLPFFGFSQKSFEIGGMSINSANSAVPTSSIVKVKGNIIISDSTFATNLGPQSQTFQIIKKVDDNYFKVTDGLQDYIVRVNLQNAGRYSGVINIESDKRIVSCFIK